MKMNLTDISLLRLLNQQIAAPHFTRAKDLVTWMGAIQAQDYPMSKWAIGLRTLKASNQSVETALDKGEILRTHVLRPTWHIVPSEDIRWMLELTAPNILTSMRSRHKQLGLTTAMVNKSNTIIEKALKGGNHSTREELVKLLEKADIKNEDNRASHLFALAELECLICSGTSKENKRTFALLSERAPKATSMHKEEALATLARRYFQSHAPANLNDFVWWSGLSITDAKHSIEAIKSELHSEIVEGKQY
ncbi:MAG TPA: winged helix DNA-binding domain-containing protein, partial [Saprospiraceae bacterium]|nr:winged helix DNA-binding domain-containing protein [Saprospiraceae bacterium]